MPSSRLVIRLQRNAQLRDRTADMIKASRGRCFDNEPAIGSEVFIP